MTLISIKHYYKPSYFDTLNELESAYKPMLDWLLENMPDRYKLHEMDNASYSDLNEDPLIGYIFEFVDEEDAMAFKLRWL